MSSPKALAATILTIAGLLFFVWPIPHTIALRNLLLLAILLGGGYFFTTCRPLCHARFFRAWRVSLALLGLLLLWTVAVSLWIAEDTARSFDNLRGLWLMALLAGSAGMFVGCIALERPRGRQAIVLLLLVPLAIHLLAIDFLWLWEFTRFGNSEFRSPGLTEGPDKSNILTNLAIVLILTGACVRWRGTPFRDGGPGWIWVGLAALASGSLFVARTRNGIAVVAVALVAVILICFFHRGRAPRGRPPRVVAAVLIGAVVFGLAAWAVHARPGMDWRRLVDTVVVALDTQGHTAWRDSSRTPVPLLHDGQPVDKSLYLRIAWAKEALLLIADRPLGACVGRNEFGRGISRKYGMESHNHSHSGILDVALSLGAPGTLLWLGFVAATAAVGLRRYFSHGNPFALAVFFVGLDFGVRMFIDSIVRDHMLQQFFFAIGVLMTMALGPLPRSEGVAAGRPDATKQGQGSA